MSCLHEEFDSPPEHGEACEEGQMGSVLGTQRAQRRQMDVEAFCSRVTVQPPPSPASLLCLRNLCREQLAFSGPSLYPPAPPAPVAALRGWQNWAGGGGWAYLQLLRVSATLGI